MCHLVCRTQIALISPVVFRWVSAYKYPWCLFINSKCSLLSFFTRELCQINSIQSALWLQKILSWSSIKWKLRSLYCKPRSKCRISGRIGGAQLPFWKVVMFYWDTSVSMYFHIQGKKYLSFNVFEHKLKARLWGADTVKSTWLLNVSWHGDLWRYHRKLGCRSANMLIVKIVPLIIILSNPWFYLCEKTCLGNCETASELNAVLHRNGSDADCKISDTLFVGNLLYRSVNFCTVISLKNSAFSVCLRLS